MNSGITVKLISKTDIIESGCFDVPDIISVMQNALLSYKRGEVLLPDKISQTFEEASQSRINCMPATLLKEKISGVKWVSVFPENPQKYGCLNVSGVIILSELEKGYPYCIMDGRVITALRTACMGAIGSKYLSRENSKVYGSIGSGEQAKMHFIAIKSVRPDISTCYVASRKPESEKAFVEELHSKYPDVEFICCNGDYRMASRDADIVVTAVSCQEPLLKADSIKPGAFYCHVGGKEDEDAVPLMADKIVCDNWNALKHRSTPTLSRVYLDGRLKDTDIYADICDIIDGTKPGRENDNEFIYFNSIGLGYIDVAVADAFYKKVVRNGNGVDWLLDDMK